MNVEEEIRLLTVSEAAERLGVTQAAVRNAIHDSRLVSTSLYGKRLIAPADLEAYRQRSQPAGEKRVGRPRKQEVEPMAGDISAGRMTKRQEAQDGTA